MNPAWSRGTDPLLGLAFAAESRHLLTWADPPQITLWHRHEILHQRRAAQPLQTGACSADGSVLVLVSQAGRVWRLGPDLRTHWELQLPTPAVTLALDPLGDLLAVSDTAGALHLLQASNGKALWRVDSPRPLHHLAFVPEAPLLIGAADTGLIAAYDPGGACRWRHGLPAHIGSLAVQGDGKVLALAGFSEGAFCFDNTGQRSRRLARLGPCRRLALSYEGHLVVLETLEGDLVLTTAGGAVLDRYSPSGRILGMALDPLGEHLLLALSAGGLLELSFQP